MSWIRCWFMSWISRSKQTRSKNLSQSNSVSFNKKNFTSRWRNSKCGFQCWVSGGGCSWLISCFMSWIKCWFISWFSRSKTTAFQNWVAFYKKNSPCVGVTVIVGSRVGVLVGFAVGSEVGSRVGSNVGS